MSGKDPEDENSPEKTRKWLALQEVGTGTLEEIDAVFEAWRLYLTYPSGGLTPQLVANLLFASTIRWIATNRRGPHPGMTKREVEGKIFRSVSEGAVRHALITVSQNVSILGHPRRMFVRRQDDDGKRRFVRPEPSVQDVSRLRFKIGGVWKICTITGPTGKDRGDDDERLWLQPLFQDADEPTVNDPQQIEEWLETMREGRAYPLVGLRARMVSDKTSGIRTLLGRAEGASVTLAGSQGMLSLLPDPHGTLSLEVRDGLIIREVEGASERRHWSELEATELEQPSNYRSDDFDTAVEVSVDEGGRAELQFARIADEDMSDVKRSFLDALRDAPIVAIDLDYEVIEFPWMRAKVEGNNPMFAVSAVYCHILDRLPKRFPILAHDPDFGVMVRLEEEVFLKVDVVGGKIVSFRTEEYVFIRLAYGQRIPGQRLLEVVRSFDSEELIKWIMQRD